MTEVIIVENRSLSFLFSCRPLNKYKIGSASSVGGKSCPGDIQAGIGKQADMSCRACGGERDAEACLVGIDSLARLQSRHTHIHIYRVA